MDDGVFLGAPHRLEPRRSASCLARGLSKAHNCTKLTYPDVAEC